MTDEDIAEHVAPELCAEHSLWEKSGYLATPDAFLRPELQSILKITDSKHLATELRRSVEFTWKINPTLVDINFVRQDADLLDVGHLPFELKKKLYKGCIGPTPKKAKKLYDYLHMFFISSARAIERTGERLVVEAVSGDITSILENFKHGLLSERNPSFPTKYDRKHLSNIP
jgi:hypothetical protein